jgi:hypothetical protein
MSKVKQDQKDWQKGYDAGVAGKPGAVPRGVDGLSWTSGYVEGKAAREKAVQELQEM